jgi:DNA replication protein DnaC
MTTIGKEIQRQQKLDQLISHRPSLEERLAFQLKEREEKTSQFEDALYNETRKQFGKKYVLKHVREQTTELAEIVQNIENLFHYGRGALYLGVPGSGKTHVLLTMFEEICRMEWEEFLLTHHYPNAPAFIERLCHFSYSSHLMERLIKGEKLVIARYNFIDDLGVGDIPSTVTGGLDDFFEEINRQGHALILSSNCLLSVLENHDRYKRIMSRIRGKCRICILPSVDRRIKDGELLDFSWREMVCP